MRLVNLLDLLLSEDADQLYKLADQKRTVDDTAVTTEKAARFTLAASAVNQELVLTPEVTNAKYVLILVEGTGITVRFESSSGTEIPISPLPAASSNPVSQTQKADAPGRLFVGPTLLTSMFFSNPSGQTAATVTVVVVGEGS